MDTLITAIGMLTSFVLGAWVAKGMPVPTKKVVKPEPTPAKPTEDEQEEQRRMQSYMKQYLNMLAYDPDKPRGNNDD